MIKNRMCRLIGIILLSTVILFVLLRTDTCNRQNRQLVTLPSSHREQVLNPNLTYAKLDRSLCEYPQREKKYYVGTIQCPRHVVTVNQGGRLCNQIWEYLAVWAAAKRTGHSPYVPTCLYNRVAAMYDSLTVGKLEDIAHCPLNETTFVRSKFDPWDKSSNLILPKYIMEIGLILDYRKDFQKEFVLRRNLAEESQRQLQSLKVPNNTVYVGVHIRKTDYAAYLKRKFGRDPAEAIYYEKAMRIFEDRYKHVTFVMVSDDPDWCYRQFGKRKSVYVIGYHRNNSAEIDLAILSSCNHTIFDYGTYGSWSAIMAGGETIYYNITYHLTSALASTFTNRTDPSNNRRSPAITMRPKSIDGNSSAASTAINRNQQ